MATPATIATHEPLTISPAPDGIVVLLLLLLLPAAPLLEPAPLASAGVDAGGAVVSAADDLELDEAPLVVELTWLSAESELVEVVGDDDVGSARLGLFDVVVSAVGLADEAELKPVQQGMYEGEVSGERVPL